MDRVAETKGRDWWSEHELRKAREHAKHQAYALADQRYGNGSTGYEFANTQQSVDAYANYRNAPYGAYAGGGQGYNGMPVGYGGGGYGGGYGGGGYGGEYGGGPGYGAPPPPGPGYGGYGQGAPGYEGGYAQGGYGGGGYGGGYQGGY